jgi:hypothetical protein
LHALSKLKALDSVKALVVLGTPFLGSSSTFQALRAERKDLHLLELLGRKSTQDIENTVQTFRGLFDMMPADQEELLKPALFAPGPLSRLSPADDRFKSPLTVVRDLPPAVLERSRAIVCTTINTTGAIVVRDDGSVDYSGIVAGDGTVPAKSALNASELLSHSIEVDQRHMTLPLDGKAIEHTVDWVGQQFGIPPKKSSSQAWPAAPEIRLPKSREELMRNLEADDELTLGDFVALISLV